MQWQSRRTRKRSARGSCRTESRRNIHLDDDYDDDDDDDDDE